MFDMPLQDLIPLAIIGINILLTLALAVIYVKNYRTIKSKVTLGFLIFAVIFLLENIADFFFYNILLSQGIYGITSFNTMVNAAEMVGLLVILWITWK